MILLAYRKVLVAIVAVALFSNLTLFLLDSGRSPITVTHVTLALALASVPLLVRPPARPAVPRGLVGWSLGFLAVSAVFVLGTTSALGEFDQFWDRIFGIGFLLLMLVIFSDPRAHRFAARAIGVVLAGSVALNVYEVANPGTFSQVLGRSAGLYENPNQAGAALVLAMIVAMDAARPRWRVALAMASGVGVAVTFSRSALAGWLMAACLASALRGQVGRLARQAAVLAVVLGVLALAIRPDYVGLLLDLGMLNRNTTGRASMEVGSESDGTRLIAAQLALESIADHPVAGLGTGASSLPPFDLVGPHNVYLALMVDHGVAGVLIFPLFLAAALGGAARSLRPMTVPLGLFLAYWGLFSHNVLEERYILIAVALAASMVEASRPARPAGTRRTR